jgi:hypothetical protein
MHTLKTLFVFAVCHLTLLTSCHRQETGELRVIPLDFEKDEPLLLSAITDDMTAIELEVTDNSLIVQAYKTLLCNDYIIILNRLRSQRDEILLFDKGGKFIRRIGSMGQGPGEYTRISDLTVDTEKEQLYVVATNGRLICYDLNGRTVREQTSPVFQHNRYINYDESGKLLLITEYYGESDENGSFNRSMLYTLNDDWQLTDSLLIRKIYLERVMVWIHPFCDFTTHIGKDTYLYFSEQNPEPFVRDTLYTLKNNRLHPFLRLQFNNEGVASDGLKCIYLFTIYRSSRFVFAVYGHDRKNKYYRFCYDLKTEKGYNMEDGYTDDLYGINERVNIRPFDSDADKFYFYHTHIETNASEEPNPTLYIGTLKH